MYLRTVESYWLLKNGLLNSYPSLQEDIECEVLVIGGGITGALISHALLDAGYEVTLIDRRDIGQGSTSVTTSMLQYEIDTPLIKLSEMIGEEDAAQCYLAGVEAIEKLDALVSKQRIECGFERKQSLYLPHARKAIGWMREEYACRAKHGLEVTWLDAKTIEERFGLKSYGGIFSQTAASIDAYRLAHGLIAKNTKRGLRVFDQTDTSDIRPGKNGVTLVAEGGHRIRAKQVVFCTGFETLSLFKKHYAQVISTFACISEQQIDLAPAIFDTLIWDTNDPYIYMRTTEDNRFLIGGGDVETNSGAYRERMKRRKAEQLIRKAGKMFPGLRFTKDFHWAGAFGVTKDDLPFIGKHPDYPHCVFVLGFGGNGIAFSVQGMELAVHSLANENHPFLHLYRFDR